jgi:hypothetical protein
MLKSRQAFLYSHPQLGLLLGSYSGPGAAVQEDWAQETVLLGSSIDDLSSSAVGAAVRAAWARCREIPVVPYTEVIAKHCAAVGVPSEKALFAGAKLVSPYLKDGAIRVEAMKQTGVGEFEVIRSTAVKLSEQASDEELGSAVIEALRKSE